VIEDEGWRLRVRSIEGRRVGEVEITPMDDNAPDQRIG
jgi:CBS domain containing-hemolysin-like protein